MPRKSISGQVYNFESCHVPQLEHEEGAHTLHVDLMEAGRQSRQVHYGSCVSIRGVLWEEVKKMKITRPVGVPSQRDQPRSPIVPTIRHVALGTLADVGFSMVHRVVRGQGEDPRLVMSTPFWFRHVSDLSSDVGVDRVRRPCEMAKEDIRGHQHTMLTRVHVACVCAASTSSETHRAPHAACVRRQLRRLLPALAMPSCAFSVVHSPARVWTLVNLGMPVGAFHEPTIFL